MNDRAGKEIEQGVYGNLLALQAGDVSTAPLDARGSSMRGKFLEIYRSSPLAAGLITFFIGADKVKQLSESSSSMQHTSTGMQPVSRSEALHQLDANGIGLIIALNPDKPGVKADLDYLSKTLPLELVASDPECSVYTIRYDLETN